MTTTFGSTELKNAGKATYRFPTTTTRTKLMSGKTYIQSTPSGVYGVEITITGICQWADIEAILSMVGSSNTLTTEHDSWTNCYIVGDPDVKESDDPGWFTYSVQFARHTV